ncbi:putative MFS family arabinose efflux permease [Paenibacillus jamilae]|uniref:MFS transporter n=1 Tax=Paenibacillus polymyxa TaxID=1406 RepID=UPI000D2FBDB3|nr:MFS transporter [Paenibacillus polymyxa]MDP9678936.1 putative MFS family arabinose efflux permease [Paenibacillus jamilae]MBY0024296.1 MFS transporter [Paenibacillus polymyxa]MBY0059290.1 MFS transporter [Paenibacillus polymyxa]MBY0068898.1 MFS transporter [Paenibacillus polymyxa]MBY0082554.1 MFS transporter [Paenibacillus polymyxa]
MNPRIVRNILFLLFALPGVAFASWVSRTPVIRDILHFSTAEMGIIIFGLAAGSLLGLLSAGNVISRIGGRSVILGSALLIVIGFVIVGLGTAFSLTSIVFVGLVIFGGGYGTAEVALNVEGSAVENRLNKTLLPAFHGSFSLGTLVGAVIGSGAAALHIPVVIHFGAMAAMIATVTLYLYRYLPHDTGKEKVISTHKVGSNIKVQLAVWKERRILLIGIIVLGMAFAEGAANDWLPLTMVDGYGVDSLTGSYMYGLFVAAMTIGRFTGGFILDKYGRIPVLKGSAVLAAVGITLVIWGQHDLLAGLGILLWGLGASLGFPVGLSAAGDDPRGAAIRVGAVATIGYIAFLVGPPGLGLLGEQVGLLHALIVVLIGVMAAGLISGAAQPVGMKEKK